MEWLAAAEKGTKEGQESDFLSWPTVIRRQMCRLEQCKVQIWKSKGREEKREDQANFATCCVFLFNLHATIFVPSSCLSSPSPCPIYAPLFQVDSRYFPPEPFSLIVSLQSPFQIQLPRPLSPSAASKIYFAHICAVSIVKSAPSHQPLLLKADSLDEKNLRMHAYNLEPGRGTLDLCATLHAKSVGAFWRLASTTLLTLR